MTITKKKNEELITTVLRLPLAEGALTERLSPLTAKSVRRQWARDIFNGLSHIHQQGIIHADIKPDNILVMADGRLVIADFGISEPYITLGDHDSSHNNEKSSMSYRDINLLVLPNDNDGYSPLGMEVDVWAAAVVLICIELGYKMEVTTQKVIDDASAQQNVAIYKKYGKTREELNYVELNNAYNTKVIDYKYGERAWHQYLLDNVVSGKITGEWKDRYHADIVQSMFVVDRHLRPSATAVVAML